MKGIYLLAIYTSLEYRSRTASGQSLNLMIEMKQPDLWPDRLNHIKGKECKSFICSWIFIRENILM